VPTLSGPLAQARCARGASAVLLLVLLHPAIAGADVLLTPFWGFTFGGGTSLIDLEQASGTVTSVLGGSMTILGEGPFGVEADFGYSPRFFETDNRLVSRSSAATLGGNFVVAMPRSITRESLRPYAVAGLGWMHTSSTDVQDLLTVNADMLATTFGGGAIGMLRPDIGVRFDFRYLRGFGPDSSATLLDDSERLSFWRLSFGVTFRY
jgi:Outer membrane protein beta-barrel domain